jgi:cyclase
MLKKRLIFTLLYDSGNFMLSRNFRLQKVGNLSWLKKNYDFQKISFYIDELIVLDISRKKRNLDLFCETLKEISYGCFVPISSGGGIRSIKDAKKILRSGADKIVLNTPIFKNFDLIKKLSKEFGQQCIVGSVDLVKTSNSYKIFIKSGLKKIDGNLKKNLEFISSGYIGELYLNSIDQDGTGQGYDLGLLNLLPSVNNIPVILAGGVGNSIHLSEGISENKVDAVATANLFNFVGDGLKEARLNLINEGFSLAKWKSKEEII